MRLALVLAVILTVAGCGGRDTPASPTMPPASSPVSPAGNWSGSISDSISGDGTMQLSLSDYAPNSLSGTWSAMFKNGESFSGPAVAGMFDPGGYGAILYNVPPPCETVSGPGGSTLLGFTLFNVVVRSGQLTAVTGRTSCSSITVNSGRVNLSIAGAR